MKKISILIIIIIIIILMGIFWFFSGQITNPQIIQLDSNYKKDENLQNNNLMVNSIIFNGILLGGYSNGIWYDESEIFEELKSKEEYHIYSQEKYIGEGIGLKSLPSDEMDFRIVDFTNIEGYNLDDFIAINGEWNAIPRVPEIQSNDSKIYKDIINNILYDNGIVETNIEIKQNYKIDLEGDGADEVILMAENVSPLGAYYTNNSYSFLFLRKIIDNEVTNIFIAKDIIVTDGELLEMIPMTYTVKAIFDANGDNKMELLIEFAYYEGIEYRLYELDNDEFKLLLSTGIYE